MSNEHTPPFGWAETATKNDVALLKKDLVELHKELERTRWKLMFIISFMVTTSFVTIFFLIQLNMNITSLK